MEEGVEKMALVLDNGSALSKWGEMLTQQGVADAVVESLCGIQPDYTVLPTAKHKTELRTKQTG